MKNIVEVYTDSMDAVAVYVEGYRVFEGPSVPITLYKQLLAPEVRTLDDQAFAEAGERFPELLDDVQWEPSSLPRPDAAAAAYANR